MALEGREIFASASPVVGLKPNQGPVAAFLRDHPDAAFADADASLSAAHLGGDLRTTLLEVGSIL